MSKRELALATWYKSVFMSKVIDMNDKDKIVAKNIQAFAKDGVLSDKFQAYAELIALEDGLNELEAFECALEEISESMGDRRYLVGALREVLSSNLEKRLEHLKPRSEPVEIHPNP